MKSYLKPIKETAMLLLGLSSLMILSLLCFWGYHSVKRTVNGERFWDIVENKKAAEICVVQSYSIASDGRIHALKKDINVKNLWGNRMGDDGLWVVIILNNKEEATSLFTIGREDALEFADGEYNICRQYAEINTDSE